MSGHPALDRLRAATEATHVALDGALDIVARLAEPAGRTAMLRRYHALHASAEPPILAWLADVAGIGARCRAGTLAAALDRRGVAAVAPRALALASRAEAWGALYVLEGSTLGGRMIRRTLRERGADLGGLEFLDPYGEDTGMVWRRLCGILEEELGDEDSRAAACVGAVATFRLAADCLGGTSARVA